MPLNILSICATALHIIHILTVIGRPSAPPNGDSEHRATPENHISFLYFTSNKQ